MPKIFKMQPRVETIEKIEIKSRKFYAALPLLFVDEGCLCQHLLISHKENGECAYNLIDLCNCKQPIPSNTKLVCEITDLDIFEYEISSKLEKDSFEYYNALNLWRLKNGINQ